MVVLLIAGCSPTYKLPKGAEEPKLQDIVSYIQTQYKMAVDTLTSRGITEFPISEADLALKTSQKTSAGGDITVLIFKPSGKFIRTTTSTVTYVLTKQPNPLGGAAFAKADNNLRDAIITVITNFHNLYVAKGLDQLTKDHIVLDIDFSIEIDASLALSFKIWGLGTDVSLETDHTVDHDLKLTFKYTPPKP